MTQVKWSKREKEYLMSLALSDGMGVEEVVTMLNDRFDNKRTKSSISGKKHQLMKEQGLTRTNKKIETWDEPVIKVEKNKNGDIKMKQKKTLGTQRNARRGWTTADEQYLVAEWTADTTKQVIVAKHMGRSLKACQSHLSRLRRHNPELHMALINRGATINVLPATTEQYTLLDRMYVGLKFRKQNKMERKATKAARKSAKRQAKLEAKLAKLRGQI